MFCELVFVFIVFAASVTLEGPLLSVRYHMALHMIGRSTNVVALVTLVWLFSCVLTHHMSFQSTSSNAGIMAHCASVRLLPRVGPFVLDQIA